MVYSVSNGITNSDTSSFTNEVQGYQISNGISLSDFHSFNWDAFAKVSLNSPNDSESFSPNTSSIDFSYDYDRFESGVTFNLIIDGATVDSHKNKSGTRTHNEDVSGYNLGSSYNWKVQYQQNKLSSSEYTEGFESGFGNWSGTADWNRNSGSTASDNTGPSGAYEGSYYAYVEGSNLSDGEEETLSYNNTASSIYFAYHMYGGGMGTLYLEGYDGSAWNQIWNKSGDQGQQWFIKNIDFGQQYNQLRFRYVHGSSYTGDVSLDKIAINSTISTETIETSTRSFTLEDVQISATLTSPNDTQTFSYPNRDVNFSYDITTNVSNNTSRVYIDGTQEATNSHSGDDSVTETLTIAPGTKNWYVEVEADDFGDTATSGTKSFTVENPVVELTIDSPVDSHKQAKRILDLTHTLNIESSGTVDLVVDGQTITSYDTPINSQQFTETLQDLDRDGQSKTWELQYNDDSGHASNQSTSRTFTIRVIETAQSTNQI